MVAGRFFFFTSSIKGIFSDAQPINGRHLVYTFRMNSSAQHKKYLYSISIKILRQKIHIYNKFHSLAERGKLDWKIGTQWIKINKNK